MKVVDGDDRGTPALQKHQHDDDDEGHRLIDRLDQLADRLRDELGRIVADIVVEPLGETGLEFDHGVGNAFGGGQRVGAGALGHQHRNRRFPEQEAVGGVVKRAQFNPGHVAQPDGSAVGTGFDDDVFELLNVL